MRYLGLDLGSKTLGISLSDKLGIIASFYDSVSYSDRDKLVDMICDIVKKENVGKIVLGYPKNMNNTCGERVEDTLKFKSMLEERLGSIVILEDERLTTKVAESALISCDMSRKKRKRVIDGVSAIVILQSFLDRRK